MPMMPCPNCQTDISTEAVSCPKCGHVMRKSGGIDSRDPVHMVGIWLAVLILLVAVAWGVNRCWELQS